jgi:N4-gp56 family major capsid protein
MATTSFPTNHPLAVKLWSKKLFVDALKATWFDKFMGDSASSLCQVKTELNKGAGDKVTYGLRMQLQGAGVTGDGTLEGNEEALTTYSDSLLIDQLRHAVRSSGKMSEQRVPFSVREEARQGLQDWWSDRLDTAIMNHLAGNSAQTDLAYTGNNVTVIADAAHRLFPSHMATGNESISTIDTLALTMIDAAVEKAKLASPMIRPVKVAGNDYYVMFIHPINTYALRTSAATTGSWFDIQKAAITGGQVESNPIFTGALGVYNGVVLHESTRIPLLVNSSGVAVANSRTCVLAGAQALTFSYGMNSSGGEMSWVEEVFDYGNQLGVSAGLVFGTKKNRFNAADFGTIAISTYAAAH